MLKKAALLAAALAIALPAFADNPPKLLHKNTHTPAPKSVMRKPEGTKTPAGRTNSVETSSFSYGVTQTTVGPSPGKGAQKEKSNNSIILTPAVAVPLKDQPSIPPPK
jgi:hypothetical protein